MRSQGSRSSAKIPALLMVGICILLLSGMWCRAARAQDMLDDLTFFGSIKDRSTGTAGAEQAADYIVKAFHQAGLSHINSLDFLTPIPELLSASLEVQGKKLEIYPWGPNMVYLPTTPKEGLHGRLIYVGNGDFSQFNHKEVKGSIVLMDMASYGNWLNADMLGAKALIFLGNKDSVKGDFKEKDIPTPVAFPRFWVPPALGQQLKQMALAGQPVEATVTSRTRWQNKMVRDCYALLPGTSPKLKNQLIVVDASYDASSHILGLAPGADQATSIAMMLQLVRDLAKHPPQRSVLFVATVGYGQGQAGMRQFVWAVTTRRKLLRDDKRRLDHEKHRVDKVLELARQSDPLASKNPQDRELLWHVIQNRAKDMADKLSRELEYARVLASGESKAALAKIEDPRPYRRLAWVARIRDLTPDQLRLARQLLREAIPELQLQRRQLQQRRKVFKSTNHLTRVLFDYDPVLYLNLHLSTHSPYMGLMELGQTYPMREDVKRLIRSRRLADMMSKVSSGVAAETGLPDLFKNRFLGGAAATNYSESLTENKLGSDIAAIGRLPAVSLVTLNDARSLWATPYDTLDHTDLRNVETIAKFLPPLLARLFSLPGLQHGMTGHLRGLASIQGRTMYIRQGELFPDQPAPDTIVSVLQGDSIFRTMSYRDGTFFIPGLANKHASYQKLIVEPYGVDPTTGRVAWTADKHKTGKENYRIKVKTDLAHTTLVMFHCKQTDVVGIFNPQDLGYVTKVELLNAATETTPVRYWYSRIDGRDTMVISVFLEKGTRFKLILSPSLLTKDFFLLHSSPQMPAGNGYLIGDPPSIPLVPYQVGEDLRLLLQKRLTNLFQHGIQNHYLQDLYDTSAHQLETARAGLHEGRYDLFWSNVVSAWAKMNVVYGQIDSTERDVLTGVMFFIALLVPFAYCMERYLFSYREIYKQIIAFFVILIITILVIRSLNPAFQLTYSPMVVIIAFFIVGLSVLVSTIIFTRFEREMSELHDRRSGQHSLRSQLSKWQALGAGFAIGVSNLNRRKLRTALTCLTLVILTFTVMSFTNVKSVHKTTRTRIAESAPYRGVLIRNQYWMALTHPLLEDLRTTFPGASVWPRGWIEPQNLRNQILTGVTHAGKWAPVQGVLGVGEHPPAHFEQIIRYGHWLQPGQRRDLLLSTAMAQRLGLNPKQDLGVTVHLMGDDFRVVGYFDGSQLESMKALDQNPFTPAYLELSQSEELSETEIEAIQTGEQILPSSSRFRYADADATVILPFLTCMEYGGQLKAITLMPAQGHTAFDIADRLSSWLAYPLFVGQNGIWFHSATSTVRYQGVANLFIPILIVIFITLNTMVGHVHERQKEIATYTSVGLAPNHVGFLFIVEAMSLAVISTVIGYILAQMSAKFLGGTPLFAQLTFNYSSLASVACIFLVFSVVFLAALYPARMAAEIAMPDVNRSWTLPEAEGDVMYTNLPFLLQFEEEKGVMGFLNSFYSAHQDVTQGSFIVDDAQMDIEAPQIREEQMPAPVCLLLRMNVWLAPFDFGIKQRIQIHCCPSPENPGYLELSLRMLRLSGERTAWVRANKGFIQTLRKQMLLWRLMDPHTKREYRQLAPVEYNGQLEVEQS